MRPLERMIQSLEKRGRDFRSANRQIANVLVTAVEDEFETEGRGRWPPLAASTLAGRRKSGGGAKMLQDTGRLAGSVRPRSDSNSAEAFTDVEYAVFHTSDEPRTLIPKRDFTDIDVDDVFAEIENIILSELTR